MHPDVAALLAVQTDDIEIHGLEERLAALMPRLQAMLKEQERAGVAVEQARHAVDDEERRQRDVRGRLDQFKQLEERNQTQLNAVTSAREATAATAQLDQARKMIGEAQRELDGITHRLSDMRHAVTDREHALRDIERAQRELRESLDADRAEIEEQLATIRARRNERAMKVPRGLLQKYDRIRSGKRIHAVFPLRGHSCAHCDTVLPLQRRSAMTNSGATEVCEGCGVLLYAGE
ncbi:MAG: zinc ribbon domain-containing protein [Gemmatimonadaceae bacterium]